MPICPQKMRMACSFQQLVQPFCFVLFFVGNVTRHYLLTFYDWSAAHGLTNYCNCLRKSCHLSSWLEWV